MGQHVSKNDQTFAGVFLIGLAILFLTSWWWPGILFVIGAAMVARAINEGRAWNADRNALVVLGMGVFFLLTDVLGNFNFGVLWPVVLIGIGVYLLYSRNQPGRWTSDDGKSKRDDTV